MMKKIRFHPFLALVLFSFSALAIEVGSGFQTTLLGEIPWGNQAGELGLLNIPEVETVGPLSFCLGPQGSIYVADTVASQVKKFSANGKFERSYAPGVMAEHLTVDSQGNLYVRAENNVLVYSGDGQNIASIQLAHELGLVEGYAQGLAVVEQAANGGATVQQVMVNAPDYTFFPVAQISLTTGNKPGITSLSATEQLGNKTLGLGIDKKGELFARTRWISRKQAGLYLSDVNGAVKKEILLITNESLGGLQFLGADTNGFLYVELERISSDNYVHLEVRKLSPAGQLVHSFEVPNDYATTVYKKLEILPDGRIVQMLTTPQGVWFINWQEKPQQEAE